jgi:hypothetical protein
MVRKAVPILAAIGRVTVIPTVASANCYGYGWGGDVRSDLRDIQYASDQYGLRALSQDIEILQCVKNPDVTRRRAHSQCARTGR